MYDRSESIHRLDLPTKNVVKVWNLYQETQRITISLGQLDQSRSQVVSTSPQAEFSNSLTVQGDSLSSQLEELFVSQNNLGSVDGRGEDSKLGLLSSHVKAGNSDACGASRGLSSSASLRNDKVGSRGGGN